MNKKKVIVFGATGSLGKYIVKALMNMESAEVTLFVRNKAKLSSGVISKCHVVVGDALNEDDVRRAIQGQDIVYTGMSGDLDKMSEILIKTMQSVGVNRIIAISSMGIYGAYWKATFTDPKHAPGFINSIFLSMMRGLFPIYRRLADRIEASGLCYTILRPGRFTEVDEVNYQLTYKGEPERGRDISRKSIASFVAKIIENPEKYANKNIGITRRNG